MEKYRDASIGYILMDRDINIILPQKIYECICCGFYAGRKCSALFWKWEKGENLKFFKQGPLPCDIWGPFTRNIIKLRNGFHNFLCLNVNPYQNCLVDVLLWQDAISAIADVPVHTCKLYHSFSCTLPFIIRYHSKRTYDWRILKLNYGGSLKFVIAPLCCCKRCYLLQIRGVLGGQV